MVDVVVGRGKRPRIAASYYLNTAPLIWSFLRGGRRNSVELAPEMAPSRCADLLATGEVDAALVPVIEFQRLDGVVLIPDVCVGSRRRVRSVVLVTRGAELEDVKSVALDNSSRTSVALTRILFGEFIGREPEWKPQPPRLDEMLETADAALIIGDPAMKLDNRHLRLYDLASLWRRHTGLGIVFAMWMARVSSLEKMASLDFAGARDEGLANVEEIISDYEEPLGLPRTELRDYLIENISFTMDADMRAGLDLFFRLAHKRGLIPRLLPWQANGVAARIFET